MERFAYQIWQNWVSMSLVSVVVPVFNAGPYLRRCLKSIREQTYSDLQIICVNDGSTDSSPEVLRQVAADDQRMVIFEHQENLGPGAARNTGTRHVVGDHLMFVDADDLLPPDAIVGLLSTLNASGSDFVSGRVLRLAGTSTWPSMLHDRAISHSRSRTHIFGDYPLLYDTTPWNKLFRHSYWQEHSFGFPEGVLFEDVSLMVEAHCRAHAVDVMEEIVYHWRRREDGIMSITMQREDPVNLKHRVASLERVRGFLRNVAPPQLRQAAETKFLQHDLGLFLNELAHTSMHFQQRFVELAQPFVAESPATVLTRLPREQRVAYQLVLDGRVEQLAEYLLFLSDHNGKLPVRRRGLAVGMDLGPARRSVPRSLGVARRRLPVRAGVDKVEWSDHKLVIEGFAFIDGLGFEHPFAAVRRLKLVDQQTSQVRTVWLAPMRHPSAGDRSLRGDLTCVWSGFRAEIPIEQLIPADGGCAQWQVIVQVLAAGAAAGSALGPPRSGAARFPPPYRGPDGQVVAVTWEGGQRLALQAERQIYGVVDAQSTATQLRLTIQGLAAPPLPPPELVLVEDPNAAASNCTSLVLESMDHRRGTGVARLDLEQFVGNRVGRSRRGRLMVRAGDDLRPLALRESCELSRSLADITLTLRATAFGHAELVLTGPRVAVATASWRCTTLRLNGPCTLPEGGVPELCWRNGAGEIVPGLVTRSVDRFEVEFELGWMPGHAGPHRLSSGLWSLLRRSADDCWDPVVAAYGCQSALESTCPVSDVSLALSVDRSSGIRLVVHALPEHLRTRAAQTRTRRSVYRTARRSALSDDIMVECWQGKQANDNPGALVEALSGPDRRRVRLVVSDRSLRTPPDLATVVRWSPTYYEQLARSRLIIANDSVTSHYDKRVGQYCLQTWHGTPLKRIGFDIERIHFRNKNYLRELADETSNWDWLISPNPYSTEVFRHALRFDGKILETGYPRNDLLAEPDSSRRDERRRHTREWLGLAPDTLAILWAPTWRDDAFTPGGGYSAGLLIDPEELRNGLTDTVILFRGHHLTGSSQSRLGDHSGIVRNVSAYPDLRDLMLASDALVTDYSSVMFDYALLNQPMILYVPDLDHFQDVRGLYLDLRAVAPGPLVRDSDELIDVIRALPTWSPGHLADRVSLRKRFCPWDDGGAADRVWTIVRERIGIS